MMYVSLFFVFFFFKQKTAYDMRISDWSSDVCSSDLQELVRRHSLHFGNRDRCGLALHLFGKHLMGTGTELGRVRGLGSARSGSHHWLHQRITAVGNLILVLCRTISLWRWIGRATFLTPAINRLHYCRLCL